MITPKDAMEWAEENASPENHLVHKHDKEMFFFIAAYISKHEYRNTGECWACKAPLDPMDYYCWACGRKQREYYNEAQTG